MKYIWVGSLLGFVLCSASVQVQADASHYQCDIPEFAAKKVSECRDLVSWSYGLDEIRKKNPKLFQELINEQVAKYTNVGSAKFNIPGKGVKSIYRASFLTESPTCIRNLVKEGDVKTIVNLYNKGDLSAHDELSTKEKATFQKEGGAAYLNILNYEYKFKDVKKDLVIEKLAEIVSTIKALPGNILVHCYGGMHRTGLVFGIMQKCWNKVPVDQVINEYRCHVAYETEQRPGGRHEENEEVLRDFPCDKVMGQ